MEEVCSIRFNQEQQNVILQKHASKSNTFLSESSEFGANKQDLITALVSREKVLVLSLPNQLPCPPPYPTHIPIAYRHIAYQ